VLEAIDTAYEQHSKVPVCCINGRLGGNGDLVAPLRQFTTGNEPPYRYTNIVMWSDAEICKHPEEFWGPYRRNPVARLLSDDYAMRAASVATHEYRCDAQSVPRRRLLAVAPYNPPP
jgi:hypothetical protein